MTGHDYGHITQLRTKWKRVPPRRIWGQGAAPGTCVRAAFDRTGVARAIAKQARADPTAIRTQGTAAALRISGAPYPAGKSLRTISRPLDSGHSGKLARSRAATKAR
jgi:hypothetical protein